MDSLAKITDPERISGFLPSADAKGRRAPKKTTENEITLNVFRPLLWQIPQIPPLSPEDSPARTTHPPHLRTTILTYWRHNYGLAWYLQTSVTLTELRDTYRPAWYLPTYVILTHLCDTYRPAWYLQTCATLTPLCDTYTPVYYLRTSILRLAMSSSSASPSSSSESPSCPACDTSTRPLFFSSSVNSLRINDYITFKPNYKTFLIKNKIRSQCRNSHQPIVLNYYTKQFLQWKETKQS